MSPQVLHHAFVDNKHFPTWYIVEYRAQFLVLFIFIQLHICRNKILGLEFWFFFSFVDNFTLGKERFQLWTSPLETVKDSSWVTRLLTKI